MQESSRKEGGVEGRGGRGVRKKQRGGKGRGGRKKG